MNCIELYSNLNLSPDDFPQESVALLEEQIVIFSILTCAADFYWESGEKKDVFQEIIRKKYDFNRETTSKLKVGYASGFGLYNYLLKKGFRDQDILKSGLFYGPYKEVFKRRIMFAYFKKGLVRSFAGRSIDTQSNRKYIKHPTNRGSVSSICHQCLTGEYIYNEDAFFSDHDYVLSCEGVADAVTAIQIGIPAISPVTKYYSSYQLIRFPDLLKNKTLYIVGDCELSGGGEKGAGANAQKLANMGLTVYLVKIPFKDVTYDNDQLDEPFKREAGKRDFNDYGREEGFEGWLRLKEDAIRVQPQVIEVKKNNTIERAVKFQKSPRLADKNNIVCEKGDFNLVLQGCPALKRLWHSEHIHYESRRLLLAFAINTKNGPDELMAKWPSTVTASHIQNAQRTNLCPYSCRKMQEHGVCIIGKDPVIGSQCLPKRRSKDGELMEASPIRFAYGLKRAFSLRKEKEGSN